MQHEKEIFQLKGQKYFRVSTHGISIKLKNDKY